MCFHLSGSMINWSRSSPLAFSYSTLYPSFPVFDCFSGPLYFLWIVCKVKKESKPSPPLPLWIFYLLQPAWRFFYFFFNLLIFTLLLWLFIGRCFFRCCPFPPIYHSFLSPRLWFLGYALLTHSDSPAVWTPCLSTDNHMLPKYSSGKNLIYFLT